MKKTAILSFALLLLSLLPLSAGQSGKMVPEEPITATPVACSQLGGPVKGGKVHGKWPGLAVEQLYEGRDLALTTDFRDVFSEILVRHMGTRDVCSVFPEYNASPALGII